MMGGSFIRKRALRARGLARGLRVGPAVEWTVQHLLDFLVPDACYRCGRLTGHFQRRSYAPGLPIPAQYLAHDAVVTLFGAISIVNHPFCRSCLYRLELSRKPSRIGVPGQTAQLVVCSPFQMNDTSLEIIRLIKFHNRRSLVPLAAGAMAHALRVQLGLGRNPVLVPVPMHPSALRLRGFNQSELLASEVSRLVGIPVDTGSLQKPVRTRRQSQTARESRARNVRGAFAWRGGHLEGRHVYLVDDLATSGATLASCTRVLLAAGARRVSAVCLAKAV